MTTTLSKPNAYPATCVRCNGRVPAGKGFLARTDTGRWAADHVGPCPEKPTAIATPVHRVDRDGIYRDDDGTLYTVRATSRGQLYAEHDDTHMPGVIHTLRADQRVGDL